MSDFVVYNMDVFDGLERMQDDGVLVDCILTSPPYWGLRDYGVEGQIGLEEHPQQYVNKLVRVFRESKKVLKDTGSLWLNLGDSFYSKSGSGKGSNFKERHEQLDNGRGKLTEMHHKIRGKFNDGGWLQPKQKLLIPHRVAIALQEDGWILRNDVVWSKPNYMPSSVQDRLTTSFEFVFHFVKKQKYYYDLDSIRVPHKESSINRQKYVLGKFGGDERNKLGRLGKGVSNGSEGTRVKTNPLGKNPADVWKPYSIQERKKEFVEYRELPELNEISGWLKEWKKNSNLTIDEIEKKMESQAVHHWFSNESYPSKKEWIKFKELFKIEKTPFDESLTKVFFKSSEKQNHPLGKNPSDFWRISPKPYPESHFAVFPPKLCEIPLKATVPKKICSKCGKPTIFLKEKISEIEIPPIGGKKHRGKHNPTYSGRNIQNIYKKIPTSCGCNVGFVAGTVLDLFAGSGTVLEEAQKMGLNAIGIELNPKYVELIKKRVVYSRVKKNYVQKFPFLNGIDTFKVIKNE